MDEELVKQQPAVPRKKPALRQKPNQFSYALSHTFSSFASSLLPPSRSQAPVAPKLTRKPKAPLPVSKKSAPKPAPKKFAPKPAAPGVSKQRPFAFGGRTPGPELYDDGLTATERRYIERGQKQALTGAAKLRFTFTKQGGKGYKGDFDDGSL